MTNNETATAEALVLELCIGPTVTKAMIGAINGACDQAEDAKPDMLLLSLRPGTAQHETLDVGLVNQWERAVRRLERLAVPTAAAVAGACGAPGLALLLATDYRVAAPDARFSLSTDGAGILPDMALHRLAVQLGGAGARRLALFGAELGAGEAADAGLIDAVDGVPEDRAVAFIAALGACREGLAVRRRLLLEASANVHEDSLGVHLAACDRTLRARGGNPRIEARAA